MQGVGRWAVDGGAVAQEASQAGGALAMDGEEPGQAGDVELGPMAINVGREAEQLIG